MKGFETASFGLTLLLVPLLAWLAGCVLGRRDGHIATVVVIGAFVALIPHAARWALLASTDTRPFADALAYQIGRTLDFTEVGLFFTSFGIFMTMLGWTATPVMKSKSQPHESASLPR